MLRESRKNLYIYVVERDFGFAPNPFHGYCTLATCKPRIRAAAKVGDWVMGVGGRRLKATGKCVFLMNVTEIISFDDYWLDDRFRIKKSYRNGSPVMMVGDNIYHKKGTSGNWMQEDSHHSNPDGTTNFKNLQTDTISGNVLISNNFFYFGTRAPSVDLNSIGYINGRGHRKISLKDANVVAFVKNIENKYRRYKNLVKADPFDFAQATKRVDQTTGRIT